MANAYKVTVGKCVSYLTDESTPRWRSAKVTAVTSQTAIKLAYITSTGSRTAIKAGADINKRTTGTQTNVWRPN